MKTEQIGNKINQILSLIKSKEIEYKTAKQITFQSKVKLHKNKQRILSLEKSKTSVIELAKQSQQITKEHIEKIVTHALQTVYDDEFEFVMEIDQKRDQQEVRFFVKTKDGALLELRKDVTAAGVLDTVATGLRLAIFSLDPNAEPIMFHDEPMKNLGEFITLGGKVLKSISKSLGIQSFIITHDELLKEIGDKVYMIGENK